jgi:hypothetical protein
MMQAKLFGAQGCLEEKPGHSSLGLCIPFQTNVEALDMLVDLRHS